MGNASIDESTLSLEQLKPGEWATIQQVQTGPTDLMRLMGLGLCAGRRLKMLKMGDPMILQVYDSRIGLSERLARRIRVIVQPDGAPDD